MERQMTQNVRVQKIYVRFALIRNRKDQKITVDKIIKIMYHITDRVSSVSCIILGQKEIIFI